MKKLNLTELDNAPDVPQDFKDAVHELERGETALMEDWMFKPTRTKKFQAFLDSLNTSAVRRAKVKPERPVLGNYATKR